MAATLVIDASVLVDFLAPGEDSLPSTRLFRGLRWRHPLTLMAPDLIFLESANALRGMAGTAISREWADKAVSSLRLLPLATVSCSSLLAGAWSLSRSLTTYDAAYVALARDLDLPYVTRDERAGRTARQAGVSAWHVAGPELSHLLDATEPLSDRTN